MNDITHISKATFYPQTHRSGNTTWVCKVGKRLDGQPDLRRFPTEAEAVAFCEDWNRKLVSNNQASLSTLSAVAQTEIFAAITKLEAYHATLPEAVDFFIAHARPPKGDITTEEAVKLFIQAKTALKRRPHYVNRCEHTFYLPFARAFPKRTMNSITEKDAQAYIDKHANWSSYSKASHISYLRTFFNFFRRQKYCTQNPFEHIEMPNAQSTVPKIMDPQNVEKLLQYALDNGQKAECATLALVFFAGVRVEEAGRLNWDDLDLDRGFAKIAPENAKMRTRRVNSIPANCLEWLRLCKAAGKVAPHNHEERLKRMRRESGVEYPQNAARHCFASYHLAKHRDANKTAFQLSHPDARLLYRTYFELTSPEAADAYWDIVPASVKPQWEAARKAQQAQANLAAIKTQLQEQTQL